MDIWKMRHKISERLINRTNSAKVFDDKLMEIEWCQRLNGVSHGKGLTERQL